MVCCPSRHCLAFPLTDVCSQAVKGLEKETGYTPTYPESTFGGHRAQRLCNCLFIRKMLGGHHPGAESPPLPNVNFVQGVYIPHFPALLPRSNKQDFVYSFLV
ncbi:unnamed protein product [Discosporangium mesarthrocarpum]